MLPNKRRWSINNKAAASHTHTHSHHHRHCRRKRRRLSETGGYRRRRRNRHRYYLLLLLLLLLLSRSVFNTFLHARALAQYRLYKYYESLTSAIYIQRV